MTTGLRPSPRLSSRSFAHQSEHAAPLRDEPEVQGLIPHAVEVLNRAPDSLQRHSCVEERGHHAESDQILERIYPSENPAAALPNARSRPRPVRAQ